MRPLNDIVFNDFTMEYLKALLTPVSKEEVLLINFLSIMNPAL
jgi:hypothetical protein